MSKMIRPLPTMEKCSKPFWDSLNKGTLKIQKCNKCGKMIHTPKYFCPDCMSDDLGWEEVSDKAWVMAYFAYPYGDTPFIGEDDVVVAMVMLECGVKMITNIVDTPHDQIFNAMELKLKPTRISDDIVLPTYTKA